MPTLLSNLPRPLLNQIVSGRCVPIIGAGFSRNAHTPNGAPPPLWNELADLLSEDLQDYQPISPIDALSAYERQYSRRALMEALTRALLIGVATPGDAHKAFCEVPFDLVVTTNFDFLLELGYGIARRYCHPILNEDELGVDAVSPRVDLLKLHGDLHNAERMVVTEEDYDSFLTRHPLMATYVSNLLISRTALFIGYSLEDSDFRQIWQVIKDRLGRMRREAYTLTVGASSHAIARFERRGVHVVNLPGTQKQSGSVLAQFFRELRATWTASIPNRSVITEEDSLAEFSVPPGVTNRLCFFSLPIGLVSLYREIVFPLAQDAGFVPITAVDVVTQGDSITAKVSALIERSQLLVFDLSSEAAGRELNLAFSLESQAPRRAMAEFARVQRMLIILPDGSADPRLSWEWRSVHSMVIWRPKDLSTRNGEFLSAISAFFAGAARDLKPEYESEPQRLLDERHPEAALITAFTLLERELRSRVDLSDGQHRVTFHELLNTPSIPLDDVERAKLQDVAMLRNRVVHGDVEALDMRQARSAVSLILAAIEKLRRFTDLR